MREKLDYRRTEKDTRLKEERDTLVRVKKEIEAQDAMKMRSSEVLKNEFLFFNDQKQLDNKLRYELHKTSNNAEKYDHFPFVSGEMLDQHRAGLGVELRADLKNYMIAKSKGQVFSSNKGGVRYSPGRSNKSGESWTGSDMRNMSDILLRSQVTTSSHMKALNDSCYVVPEKNHRVVQDNDPVKAQAVKAALNNYENQVCHNQKLNEKFMRSHYGTIEHQKEQYELKESNRKAQIHQNSDLVKA